MKFGKIPEQFLHEFVRFSKGGRASTRGLQDSSKSCEHGLSRNSFLRDQVRVLFAEKSCCDNLNNALKPKPDKPLNRKQKPQVMRNDTATESSESEV